MKEDSVEGIYDTIKQSALISKGAGGIGISISNIRASKSYIRGTNGESNGIVPMLRVLNDTARYIDQCIHPGTIIYTDKGPMEIQNCDNENTKIFNSSGKAERIKNILEHSYNGNIFTIDIMHSLDPLRITGEHPVLILQGQQKGLNYKLIKNRLEKKIISIKWIESKNINVDDMVVYKIPKYCKDNINITGDDCYFYGIVLGDGCVNNKNTTGHVTLHTITKNHILEFIKNYFESKFIVYNVTVDGNTVNKIQTTALF
jgi:hypothetical protein